MAKVVSLFNNKGGVSKTTTCFNLGWMLAKKGYTVVMVDADPQCNLTGMVLDLAADGELDRFYEKNPGRNIKEALDPAFQSRPMSLESVNCVPVEGIENLWLIPGHVGLAEHEGTLGIAQQLSESVQTLRNLPGSIRFVIDRTAERYDADFVLLDLSPSLGAINQNLVTTSDFFILPTSPDVFSVMAISSLARVIPKWISWGTRAAQLEILREADYPFLEPSLKFLGLIVQRYRLRSDSPTRAFQKYFDELDRSIGSILIPRLSGAGVCLPDTAFEKLALEAPFRLASVPDFNTLIAVSQDKRRPVFSLKQEDIGQGGQVWENQEISIERFRALFDSLANTVITLTGVGDEAS